MPLITNEDIPAHRKTRKKKRREKRGKQHINKTKERRRRGDNIT